MSASPKHSGPDYGDSALRRENERLRTDNQRLRDRVDANTVEISDLKAQFARYEIALRGSNVTVFTQDHELRYTSISSGLCGRSVDEMLGKTDAELFPQRTAATMTALKRAALESGTQQRGEVAVEASPTDRWLDLHIEPLRSGNGAITGVACAAVDISKSKDDEAHLRLLLRELTHRSKNLLAVIQAMARQTARHAGSISAFLGQFAGRLQALAAAHDLLVRESWHGASVQELVRAQLAAYMDSEGRRVHMQGPPIVLKPEAAQSLGLALHEMAANAARFGALSVAKGHIEISWGPNPGARGDTLVFDWREESGPPVKAPRKKGFGSTAIERNLAHALEAEVSLEFEPAGLHCRVIIPARYWSAANEMTSAP